MWTKNNIPDLSGKTVIVTGANNGIGLEITHAVYEKGATVIMACRNSDNAEQAVRHLKKRGGNGTLKIELLDLANLKQIKGFSDKILNDHEKIDLLFNNAGTMVPPAAKTDDGFELQFGVNFLGHFALTGHLYPRLKTNKGARIVTMSSGAHKFVDRIDFGNLRLEIPYDAFREYAVSKLANLQFMCHLHELATLKGDQLLSLAAHPGVSDTGLSRHMAAADYDAAVKQFGKLMPAWQGALPALFAGISDEVNGGEYFGPDGLNELKGYPARAAVSAPAVDSSQGALLWDYACQHTGLQFP